MSRLTIHGQALTEFLVTMACVTPLVMGSVWLAKLGSTRQALNDASRYAAWDAIIRPASSAALSKDMLVRRTLSAPGQRVTQSDRVPIKADHALKPLLAMPYSTTPWMMAPRTDLTLRRALVDESLSGFDPATQGAITGMQLDSPRLTQATAEAAVGIPATFATAFNAPLTMSTTAALAPTHWAPTQISDAESSIRRTLLTHYLDGDVSKILQEGLGSVFRELKPNSLKLGHVDMAPVPCHRLTLGGKTSC